MLAKATLVLTLGLTLLAAATDTSASPGMTTRVSVPNLAHQPTLGGEANRGVFASAISADGRFIAFESHATNLVLGDTNDTSDVFVHDRQAVSTTRVSVDSSGNQGAYNSWDPSISDDGRFVAFESQSAFVSEDAGISDDAYVHDTVSGITVLISVDATGTQAQGGRDPAISSTGRFIAFEGGSLVSGDTNGTSDIYVRDRDTDNDGIFDEVGFITMTRVSVGSGGEQANGPSEDPSISDDGRFVAFMSGSSNLVGGAGVAVHDRLTGQTSLVSRDSAGNAGNRGGYSPSISADGRFVAFYSDSSNLVAGDTNTCPFFPDPGTCIDTFVHDRLTGETERVSVDSGGDEANGSSSEPAISEDGRYVTFWSFAGNLSAGDTNSCLSYTPSCPDVFIHDRFTAKTTRVSVDSQGNQALGATHGSRRPVIDASGRYISFDSDATNLVASDTNSVGDVFVHDLGDADNDGEWDPFDPCPANSDCDGDGFEDGTDNCPAAFNPGQQDQDGDGVGDACDYGGNVDCDGDVDAVDALRVLRAVAGLPNTLPPGCVFDGDVDCDGDTDAVDALRVLRYVAGLGNTLPPGCPPIGPAPEPPPGR